MTGPRVIEKHAFVYPTVPNPAYTSDSLSWYVNEGKLCGHCRLPEQAEVHWEIAHEHEMGEFEQAQLAVLERHAAALEEQNRIQAERLEIDKQHNEMHLRGIGTGPVT